MAIEGNSMFHQHEMPFLSVNRHYYLCVILLTLK